MNKLVIEGRIPFDKQKYADRAETNDFATLITEPTLVYERMPDGNEKLQIVYDELPTNETLAEIELAVDLVKYGKVTRIGGTSAETRTFGSRPAHAMRANQQSCGSARLAQEQPNIHAVIARGSEVIADIYEQYNPTLYQYHSEQTNTKVRQDYHLEETAFTSGIINKNNPLGYHYDKGNFSDVWSGMIVYKRFIEGGYLSIPEFNIGVELKNRSLLLFDGQGLIHGVTPIKKLHPTLSRRYSLVYYSLQRMWKCLPITEELQRTNEHRMEIERKKLDPDYAEKFREVHGTHKAGYLPKN